jgi:hypothetical protein
VSVPLTNNGAAVLGAASTGKRKMMKSICCLSSAALGVALLSACGSTTPVELDKSKLSMGDNNQVTTGGYIWTYTDHNPKKTDAVESDNKTWNYHASIQPLTNPDTPFVVTNDGGEHGNVLNVKGEIPGEIPWPLVSALDPVAIDSYWPTFPAYDKATIPAYPAAGLGFGFQPGNAVYDATQDGKYVGVAFDMKANTNMELVWVSMPTEDTDLPDPDNDKFTKKCTFYTAENPPDGGASSCFTNYRAGIFSSTSTNVPTGVELTDRNTMAAPGTWKRYCVLFSEFAVPSWASPAVIDLMKTVPFNPQNALKVQWDMFQPKEGFTALAKFDVSVDNISMVTPDQLEANNCGGDAGQ